MTCSGTLLTTSLRTGFNTWGYQGGCDFAYGTCSGQQPEGSYFCDVNSETADEMCTADRVSTGICMGDSQDTYDGCSKVKEYSNGGCTGSEFTRPPATASIDGWYAAVTAFCHLCTNRSAALGYTDVTSELSSGRASFAESLTTVSLLKNSLSHAGTRDRFLDASRRAQVSAAMVLDIGTTK